MLIDFSLPQPRLRAIVSSGRHVDYFILKRPFFKSIQVRPSRIPNNIHLTVNMFVKYNLRRTISIDNIMLVIDCKYFKGLILVGSEERLKLSDKNAFDYEFGVVSLLLLVHF